MGEDDLFRHIPSGRASKRDAVELSATDIGHAVDIDHLVGSHAGVEAALDGAAIEIEIILHLDAAALVGITEFVGKGSALCGEEDVGNGVVGSPLGTDSEVIAAVESARAVGIGANVEAGAGNDRIVYLFQGLGIDGSNRDVEDTVLDVRLSVEGIVGGRNIVVF